VARVEVIEATQDAPPVEALLSADQVGALFSVHRSTVFRMVRDDATFPRPLKLSRNTPRWRATELNAWIERLAKARE
jgi:predicted DNA-binding transcriptional regulator AlpA